MIYFNVVCDNKECEEKKCLPGTFTSIKDNVAEMVQTIEQKFGWRVSVKKDTTLGFEEILCPACNSKKGLLK